MTEERDEGRAPSPEARALGQLAREAKVSLQPPELDWDAMEARLMARVAQARPVERVVLAREVTPDPPVARLVRLGAVALAAAAAVAVFVRAGREGREGALLEAPVAARSEAVAGSLRATEGAGEVRVGGVSASAGHVLRAGDLLEADGARAVLERPRKVTWLLEKEAGGVARARLDIAAESLIVRLDEGAIEAQVVPVATGEAFAVDVAAASKVVRVAVHGTHLRVARAGGSRVVVDLSEGVVSIGPPPRSGSTLGTLVTAPAHVEFDAADLASTLRVDHAPASVRAPVALGTPHEVAALPKEQAASRTAPPAAVPPTVAPPAVAAAEIAAPAARMSAPTAPSPRTAPAGAPTVAVVSRPVESPPAAAVAPRDAIAAAVRACAAGRGRPSEVRVTVSSTLRLEVGPNGAIESAVFAPPLLPDIQTCAASAIYKIKLEAPGPVTIPIDFSY